MRTNLAWQHIGGKKFKRDCLEDEIPKAQFHDKITMKRLKKVSDIRKKISASNSNNVILQADGKVLGRTVRWQKAAISR